MSGLPEGWITVSLVELITLNQKFKDIDGSTECGFVPMSLVPTRYLDDLKHEVREWGECKKGYTHFKDNDVLLAKITPCFENGKSALVQKLPNGIGAGSTEYFVMRCHDGLLHPKYLLAFIKTKNFMDDCRVMMSGSVGHKRVPKDYLLDYEVPVAPLNEQIHIANKLDTLLAKVEKAQARLEKIPVLLKRFRQSVLAAATSGELTREWREERSLGQWQSVSLIDVVRYKPRNGRSPKGVNYETPIKNLTLSAVTKGYFQPQHFKFVDIEVEEDSYLWIKKNDLLIQRANSLEYVGTCALYKGENDQFIYPDLIMKCQTNDRIIPDYLYYSISSEKVKKYFRDNATGTSGNMPKINQAVVSAAPVLLPSIEEQTEIVRRVESLFTLADKAEAQYQATKTRLDKLTQSILAKAFQGELVPQDPSDEPASELLKRIQAERAAQAAKPKTRKAKSRRQHK